MLTLIKLDCQCPTCHYTSGQAALDTDTDRLYCTDCKAELKPRDRQRWDKRQIETRPGPEGPHPWSYLSDPARTGWA
jgi:hypothetical protein